MPHIMPGLREAGAQAARIVRVSDTHLVLLLEFVSAEDVDRVATDGKSLGVTTPVGGPRSHRASRLHIKGTSPAHSSRKMSRADAQPSRP